MSMVGACPGVCVVLYVQGYTFNVQPVFLGAGVAAYAMVCSFYL